MLAKPLNCIHSMHHFLYKQYILNVDVVVAAVVVVAVVVVVVVVVVAIVVVVVRHRTRYRFLPFNNLPHNQSSTRSIFHQKHDCIQYSMDARHIIRHKR